MKTISTKRRRCQRCLFPKRYLQAIMAGLGVYCIYNMRISAGLIVRHIAKLPNKTVVAPSNLCHFNTTPFVALLRHRQYDWNEDSLFKIKISFFIGYIISHVPAGYLSDKYNPKYVFGSIAIAAAIINLLIPVLVVFTGKWTVCACFMFLLGLTSGMTFPALFSVLSRWTPSREKGRITSFSICASQFSILTNNFVTLQFMEKTNWTHPFYLYSGVAAVWWILWNVICYPNPRKHPFISTEEEQYLNSQLDGHVSFEGKVVPWFKLLTSRPVWAFVAAQTAHTWLWHTLIHNLPIYMNTVLKYNPKESRLNASLPYGMMGFSTMVQGFLSDFLINRGYVRRTTMRVIFSTIGAMGPPIFLVGASFSGCHRDIAVLMFTIGMILKSSYYTGTMIIALDLAPNFCGIIMGLANGFASFTGILQPALAKVITPNKTVYEWRNLFCISLCWSLVANLLFVIFGTGREQSWNKQQKK